MMDRINAFFVPKKRHIAAFPSSNFLYIRALSVPLFLLKSNWFFENIEHVPKKLYSLSLMHFFITLASVIVSASGRQFVQSFLLFCLCNGNVNDSIYYLVLYKRQNIFND